MRFLRLPLFICLFITITLSAQTKQITLEEIWGGAFRTERMDVLHSMKNGQQYSVLNFDRNSKSTSIDIYDYKTLKKIETLVNSSDISELKYFTDYTFSKDESKIVLATNQESIYRRSKLGNYYVYDTKYKSISLISENKIQEPTFSPDGTKVAYGFENNLYIKNLTTGAPILF